MNTVVPLPRPQFERRWDWKGGHDFASRSSQGNRCGHPENSWATWHDPPISLSWLHYARQIFFFFSQRQVYLILVTLTLSFKYGISFVSLLSLFGSYFVQNVATHQKEMIWLHSFCLNKNLSLLHSVCNRPHRHLRTLSSSQTETLVPMALTPHLLPKPLAPTSLHSVSLNLIIQGPS